MQIYKSNENNNLNIVEGEDFESEKEIQKLCEKNINSLFNLELIESEASFKKFRFDTLAFDNVNNAFTIIEYKNKKSFSVVDQGYAYLATLLNNKSDVLLRFIEKKGEVIKEKDIDWSQSKVIFVAPQFNKYQMESLSVESHGMPFELFEIKKYKNDLFSIKSISSISSLDSAQNTSESFAHNNFSDPTNLNNDFYNIEKTKQDVIDEIKVYKEQDHRNKSLPHIKKLFDDIKEKTLLMGDNVTTKINKTHIAFWNNQYNFLNIVFLKDKLKLILNFEKESLKDPKRLFREISRLGGYATGNYDVDISSKENLQYILECIKQSYELSKELTREPYIPFTKKKEYDEEYHLSKVSEETKNLYLKYKAKIFLFSETINIHATKNYIAFRKNESSFAYFVLKNEKIWVYLKLNYKLDDQKEVFRKVNKVGGYAPGNYDTILRNLNNFEYILEKIKYSFDLR